jgi:hypothetical protein
MSKNVNVYPLPTHKPKEEKEEKRTLKPALS